MSQWNRGGSRTVTLPRGGGFGSQASKKPCANPIFEQWLGEWREDAVQKNSKMQYVYAKAISSLRKYPLPLSCGRECLILEFFGPSIAKMIDKRMADENMIEGDSQGALSLDESQEDPYKKPAKKRSKKATNNESSQESEDQDAQLQPKKKTTKKGGGKRYIPAHRSGPYALLVALGLKELQPGYRGYMTKTELLQDASLYCDASMSRSNNPSTNYTAWNGMAGLVTKELVLKRGNPVHYMLTPEGRNLTAKLLQADHGITPEQLNNLNSDEVDNIASQASSQASTVAHHRTHLEPGQFEVVLYVDTSETTAKCKKEEVIGELRKNGVSIEVVRLSVGDFIWVCREVVHSSENRKRLTISRSAEMVLPYVVERKRSDDLAGSIKDGRFHEQKFRLKQTGLQPIYLIESYGNGDWGLADGALNQAVANTQMTNDFLIQETASIKDTCAYLTHMTRYLKKIYECKKVSSCNKQEWPTFKDQVNEQEIHLMIFSDFNDFGTKAKNWTVTEMFARHLMRLRGLSVERAYAIIQKYPTLSHLLREYERCSSDKERELVLASIYFGNSGRTIGPALSRAICKLYCSTRLPA